MSESARSVAWEKTLALATLLLVCLIAAGPVWGPGLLNTRGGGDSPFLLLRTHQLAANLRSGVLPARWMPDAAYGFGYPFFSYYAALPYYVAAGFTLIGLDILTAIKLTQTLFFAAAAVAMYHWAKRVLGSSPGAWLAAVAYTSAPFHLVNVYVRGDSLSEFAAFAFYPLIFLGLDRLARQPTLRRTLFPALAYAGLILTHNVSALIFTPFILLYAAHHVLRRMHRAPRLGVRRYLGYSLWLTTPLLLALLLSAGFWLPALRETAYVQLEAQTTGYFFYGNHFQTGDLVQWSLLFDYALSPDRAAPFAMGLVQALMASAGVLAVGVYLVRRRRGLPRGQRARFESSLDAGLPQPARWTLIFAVLGLLLSTWLITPLSRPVWDHVPLLPLIQFPWRFLSVQALFAALLSGASTCALAPRERPVRSWIGAAILGALLIAAALVGLRPTYLAIRADEVTVERLQLYELFTGNVGSTIRHEYLPRWVRPRPQTGPALLAPEAPAGVFPVVGAVSSASRLQREPIRRLWEVDAGDAASQVAFPLYYWPGWQAAVDGVPAEVRPAPGSGYLSLDIPPGVHSVEIWLGRTPLRAWSEAASLLTALTLSGIAVIGWVHGPEYGERVPSSRTSGEVRAAGPGKPHGQSIISGLPFVVLVALLLAFHPRVTATGNRDLTMDFDEKPYLHHNPDGVEVAGWRMIRYDYSEEKTTPGEILDVTLDVVTKEGARPAPSTNERTELRLISPAAVRHELLPPLAQAPIALDNNHQAVDRRVDASLPVPPGAAPGLYFVQIAGSPPITLRPVRIGDGDPAEGKPVLATFAGGAARLHAIDVTQSTPGRLNVELAWSAIEPISANYGLSLSLTDPAGNEWLHQGGQPGYDTQPGHGFLPTSLWPVGQSVMDHHVPVLLPGAPPSDQYTLTLGLYQVLTWEGAGEYTVPVALAQTVERRDAPTIARLGPELALSRLDLPGSVWQGDKVEATAYWSVAERPSKDYTAEWRLETPETSITSTEPLAPGSSPTGWPVGAWIAGRTRLSLPPTVPPGDYSVVLTLRDPTSGVAVGSYAHPEPVQIRERERAWELPAMGQTVGAQFGGMIELAGYDLRQAEHSVHLTLHWRALAEPDHHYTFFVHLADPETGQPVSQVDGMPKDFTYPTGLWVSGEVVSDEVELSLEAAPPGRYDLAVGWYDPDTKRRLRAVDNQGTPLLDDRLLLPHGVSLH